MCQPRMHLLYVGGLHFLDLEFSSEENFPVENFKISVRTLL